VHVLDDSSQVIILESKQWSKTDSRQGQDDALMTVIVAAAVEGDCIVGTIPLPEEVFLTTDPGTFLANGKKNYNCRPSLRPVLPCYLSI
jgi:hypothetical protein